ncbi:hypothetical protein F4809DRAFT_638872 [Biscogniauxia mediterranea]|nr:hypothetical protein F4809DRAFT_638872 [Biscogniauxia mediterranea]
MDNALLEVGPRKQNAHGKANCGFDIFPPIKANSVGKESYQRFLDEIIITYDDVYDEEGQSEDSKVLQVPTDSSDPDNVYIYFMISECPNMSRNPDRCDYFLRFQLQGSAGG